MLLSPLTRLGIPLVLLIAAVALLDRVSAIEPVYGRLLLWLPYLTFGIAIALSIFFNRARLFTAALAVLVSYGLIHTQLQTSLAEPGTLCIYTILSIVLPLTLLLLCVLPGPGLRNRFGVLMASIILAELLIAVFVLEYVPATTATPLINMWFPIKPYAGYILSVFASICYVLSALVGLVMLCRQDSETVAALLAVMLFSFVTFARFDQPRISSIMFAAAGISLIISLVRRSYDMAYRDDLTGLLGRRALNERLKGLGRGYVIAMLDIDHFKKLNDTYGHDVGDEVLKMVARQIAAVRGGGTAYRYGGEEFCVVFTGKDLLQCKPFLEEIRKGVSSYQMTLRNSRHRPESEETGMQRRGRRTRSRDSETVSVTISIGVSGYNEQLGKPQNVLKEADAALYKAKTNGRNCLAYKKS
ncbi:MAG: hypothetical protein A2W28_05125 [Gammaproteobacteria bacterium RBG_16_51_14]|nr:MAG: hypothetical protein A2W28_05125 [Gammaproteobacteria bacterium RBG_16_51_14]